MCVPTLESSFYSFMVFKLSHIHCASAFWMLGICNFAFAEIMKCDHTIHDKVQFFIVHN